MRLSRLLPGVLALLIARCGPAAADGFLSAVEDLPLAPGLNEMSDAALSFDTPGGRIVEGAAKGAVDAGAVLRFYGATLPQLGWVQDSDTRFHRESETLRLEPTSDGRILVVRFTISPE